MSISFIEFIKSVIELPKEQEDKFNFLILYKNIRKGEYLIKEGEFYTSIIYVNNGFFRYFYRNQNGEECTKGFFTESRILISHNSMLRKRASYFTIQALEDSSIEIVDFVKFQKLFNDHPCWNQLLVAISQKTFTVKEKCERDLLLFDVEQRHRAFLRKFPTL